MKVLLVGSNPTPHNIMQGAFVGTRSGRTLAKWLEYLQVTDYRLINSSDRVLPYGKNLRVEDFNFQNILLEARRAECVIALGKNAAKALTLAKIEAFQLPHPSGLNRTTNDPVYLRILLDSARDYIQHKGADHA